MKIKSGISRLFWDRASHPNPRVRREGVGNEPVGAVCCLPYMPAPTGQGAPSYRAGLQGISSKTTWKGTSAQCLLGTGKVVAVVPRRPPPRPPPPALLSAETFQNHCPYPACRAALYLVSFIVNHLFIKWDAKTFTDQTTQGFLLWSRTSYLQITHFWAGQLHPRAHALPPGVQGLPTAQLCPLRRGGAQAPGDRDPRSENGVCITRSF